MDVLTRYRRREENKPEVKEKKSKEKLLEELYNRPREKIHVSYMKPTVSGDYYAVYGFNNDFLFLITKEQYDKLI